MTGELSHSCPEPHVGHRWRSGSVHGGRRLGLDLHRRDSIGTPPSVCRLACLHSAATASPPCSRSPWGLPGCMARPQPATARIKLALRMDHGSQTYLSDHFTNQIKFCQASSRPTPSSPSPRPTASPSGVNRTLKEQIIHGRIYRNIAELHGRRPRLRRTLQCPVDRRKERLPEPRSSSSGVARRDRQSGPPRETNLCPRSTGCATVA